MGEGHDCQHLNEERIVILKDALAATKSTFFANRYIIWLF